MKHQDDYQFWVYILSNRSRTIHIGMTNGLTAASSAATRHAHRPVQDHAFGLL